MGAAETAPVFRASTRYRSDFDRAGRNDRSRFRGDARRRCGWDGGRVEATRRIGGDVACGAALAPSGRAMTSGEVGVVEPTATIPAIRSERSNRDRRAAKADLQAVGGSRQITVTGLDEHKPAL